MAAQFFPSHEVLVQNLFCGTRLFHRNQKHKPTFCQAPINKSLKLSCKIKPPGRETAPKLRHNPNNNTAQFWVKNQQLRNATLLLVKVKFLK